MTNEEQNIVVAEWCGWKYKTTSSIGQVLGISPEKQDAFKVIPNYDNDLNAMHEAEKNLNCYLKNDLVSILWRVCGNEANSISFWTEYNFKAFYSVLHATASQRREALLRTIGKWKD